LFCRGSITVIPGARMQTCNWLHSLSQDTLSDICWCHAMFIVQAQSVAQIVLRVVTDVRSRGLARGLPSRESIVFTLSHTLCKLPINRIVGATLLLRITRTPRDRTKMIFYVTAGHDDPIRRAHTFFLPAYISFRVASRCAKSIASDGIYHFELPGGVV